MVRRQRSLMGGNDANQGNNGQKQQQRPRLQSGQGHVLARGRCRIDNSLLLWWYYFLIPGILRPVVGCTRRLGHTVRGQYADADAAATICSNWTMPELWPHLENGLVIFSATRRGWLLAASGPGACSTAWSMQSNPHHSSCTTRGCSLQRSSGQRPFVDRYPSFGSA